jgi:dextranase
VIFNAVENWPIETVAPTSQDATNIEVWPPFVGYGDLQSLILGAHALAPEKQVILAAYLSPLAGAMDDALPPAETATRLASAAIWANGGFHLLLGENNGALCDPYYPKYATLMPDFARTMRRYYDFVVRYENVLCDRSLVTQIGVPAVSAVKIDDHAHSPLPAPGKVWTIVRSMPGIRTLSLINLASAADVLWNSPKPQLRPMHDLVVSLSVGARATSVFVANPDGSDPRPRLLKFSTHGSGPSARVEFVVPVLDCWTLVVVRVDETEFQHARRLS